MARLTPAQGDERRIIPGRRGPSQISENAASGFREQLKCLADPERAAQERRYLKICGVPKCHPYLAG